MTNRLRRYIEARKRGEWGWKNDYERDELPADRNWPWLAGHYGGMLDDLLDALGEKRIRVLLDMDDSNATERR